MDECLACYVGGCFGVFVLGEVWMSGGWFVGYDMIRYGRIGKQRKGSSKW